MKVLHYIPSIDRTSGGVGSYLQLLAHDLGRLVDLHIVSHHSEHELVIENCRIHYISEGLTNLHRARKEFTSLLHQVKPDLVHVNSCWDMLCSYTVFWAKALNYKVLITTHGMLEPWVIRKNYFLKKLPALLLYQRKSLRLADALVATAESERSNLEKLGYNKQVDLVPNGIVIDNIALKESWKPQKVIFFLALLRPNKGADLLIETVAALKNELAGYKVIIAGTGNDKYAAGLKQLVRSLELEEIISLPGGIYDDAKWELYRRADVFVLHTLNENFGIVIAEALASGIPVITTKGAPWPGLAERKCGWWIDRDVDNLTAALREFISLPAEEREQMRRRGRQYIEENYTSAIVAARCTTFIRNIKAAHRHEKD
ncbi:MAG: glycosyltransferase [Bacteroides sp.]|nr:glycosyltransferase [Bacteroides sp.]